MCGITGWLDWERDMTGQGSVLEAMADTLKLRGPDAGGVWLAPRVGLAHRRLIVIDPAGGVQPMTRRVGDQTYAITYNGELYNFRELRRELEARGHLFESHSDTEVLLRSYIEWGPECVERFIGIFAFAIWDEAKQQLFLGRDHLGVKPLFYAERDRAFLFGSELKALLKNPLVLPEIDSEGMAQALSGGGFRVPGHGVYRGVKEVKAGHVVLCTRDGVQVRQYWKLESHEHAHDYDTTVLHVRELLEDIVDRQLVSDMPISTLLSGGLDSSGVTAMAAKKFREAGRETLNAYTIDFVDHEKHLQANVVHRDSDYPWAVRVSEHADTNLHTILLDTPDFINEMFAPMRARDLPAAGEMETSLYVMFKRMKEEVTVSLSGESADEVFGGYPWFYMPEMRRKGTFPWGAVGRAGSLLTPEVEARLRLNEFHQEMYQDAINQVPKLQGESQEQSETRELFHLHMTNFLPFLLDRKDRMSMAASLEVRVPFCDHRLVEYMWNVPWDMKFAGNIEKGLLRDALSHVLPEDVVRRRKTSYPGYYNPAYLNAVRTMVEEVVNDANSPIRGLFDQGKVRELLKQADVVEDSLHRFMLKGQMESIVQVDRWMREYKISIV